MLHTCTARVESRIPASMRASRIISAPLALGYPLSSSVRSPTPVNKAVQENTCFQSRRHAQPEKPWGWALTCSPPDGPAFPRLRVLPAAPHHCWRSFGTPLGLCGCPFPGGSTGVTGLSWHIPDKWVCGVFYAGLYPMISPSFTLIAVGNMWSLIKNIFSVEIAFISWANFSWPSTHQSFFGKGNSSLWVSKCQATEQKERGGERGKNNSQVCCKAFVQKVLEGFLFSP